MIFHCETSRDDWARDVGPGNATAQPGQLPVAANPPVLSARVADVRGGIVVVDDHIGEQPGPRVVAFDQVVGEQCVLGKATVGRELERIDVVDALAGETAFAYRSWYTSDTATE